MGTTVVRIPFGIGEIDALDEVKERTVRHSHRAEIRPHTNEWVVTITSPTETSEALAEIYSADRRSLKV